VEFVFQMFIGGCLSQRELRIWNFARSWQRGSSHASATAGAGVGAAAIVARFTRAQSRSVRWSRQASLPEHVVCQRAVRGDHRRHAVSQGDLPVEGCAAAAGEENIALVQNCEDGADQQTGFEGAAEHGRVVRAQRRHLIVSGAWAGGAAGATLACDGWGGGGLKENMQLASPPLLPQVTQT
jgi:hypothetical protein